MNKIVNIIKPTGMTSHDVVSAVRKILNTKKVGHTGTLDPECIRGITYMYRKSD